MPSFPKPTFPYAFSFNNEIQAIRRYRDSKPALAIPKSTRNNLVMATWNIANLGGQDRQPDHLQIIAEMLSWFDIVAVQEIKDNSADFLAIMNLLGRTYGFVFSDASGNNERMAFVYKIRKVRLKNEFGELDVPVAAQRHIKLPGITAPFTGFDRSPFLASFSVNQFDFSLLNVHLYFGNEREQASIDRRCLEAYCIGRWADLRSGSKYSYTKTVFALGDFNLPKLETSDPVYKALVRRGLQLPDHTSKVYSNISNDKAYDQIAFLPGMKSQVTSHGVFPFDNALFADLWQSQTPANFRKYVKYYISDHRPMWMEVALPPAA